MAGAPDVKQLLLQVDASVELLRRNLGAGQARVDQFASDTQRRLDSVDRRFGQLGRPLAGLNTSIAATRREIASIGTSVDGVESRIRGAAGGIKAALLASASGIAAAFSADRVKDYADGYTRYTNQLKIAGLEGAQLAKVQNELFGVAQRYGVQLESVGTLYGRLSQGAKELGASQGDLLRFTNGVGAALKVQGGDAAASQGALLQLSQALGGTYVRAEEFNSINEGARPILQAVANGIDKYKGSVSALRADVIAGTVTSKDFFQGFLNGSAKLEQQATRANLTIGASFTILNNALGKYIGESDASVGASARVSDAIIGIANNLDAIVPALTVVGVGFATRFAIGPIAAAATAIATLRTELFASNVILIGGKAAAAAKAEAVAAGARTEVAAIEATIATRRADQAAMAQSLTLIEAQRAAAVQAQVAMKANAALGFGTAVGYGRNDAVRANQDLKAQIATKRALAAVDAELAAAETALAGAQTRAAAATTAASAAAAEASIASRAAAASSRLFAGALTLIGGSVAGGAAVLVLGALVLAVMHFRSEMQAAEERNRATAASMRDAAESGRALNQKLAELAVTSSGAAAGVAQVGASAANSTGKVLTFAGAVGEAAGKLRDLAEARRHEQVVGFAVESASAEHKANEAQARISARNASRSTATAKGEVLPASAADQRANADDAKLVAEYRARQGAAYRAAQQAAQIPLASRVRESDRVGGRDVDGDLARVTRDLVIARERGIRSQVDSLEAQKYELTQYKKYRADKLSPQAAQEAASADAAKFRGASAGAQGDRDAKTGRASQFKADRAAAAAGRRQAAVVRDAAGDERAYSAAERQANNDIAAARADLTNSAIERAAIEKARIESERINRDNEIAQQAKQGGLGVGTVAETRKLELQKLNTDRAQLETQVVDAREKQRIADEALAIAQANRGNQVELLQKQADLVTSAGERRDLERRILAIQYDEERAKLEGVIASRDTAEAEKKIARQRLAMLGELQESDGKSLDRKNAGPVEQYRERLRAASGDMHDALDGVVANGLGNVEDGLLGIVTGTESVGSAFKKMAASIISDLARIAIQKAILSAIGGGFLGFAGGGSLDSVPGRASGGSLGGLIQGPGTGTSDSILAMLGGPGGGAVRLSDHEFIMNERAVDYYGADTMAAINARKLPRFASGGSLSGAGGSRSTPRLPSFGDMNRQQRVAVDFNATIDANENFDVRMSNISARHIGAAAEPIMAGASAVTIRKLKRQQLPGGPG